MSDAPSASAPGSLPSDVTSFVGRREVRATVKRLLSLSRLVTLIGIGGVGKSRLAVRTAEDVRRAFPGGVWLAELFAVENPLLVADTVAISLGLRGPWPDGALRALEEFLAPRQVLLLLDNCEHLVDACADLAARLLRACPDLRILATSRQGLGIAGEQVLSVPPLSIPDEGPFTPQALSQVEGVALFLDRARAALPEFRLDDDNVGDVAAICRQLEGIPLALELAAVWLRVLAPGQIVQRLSDRFQLLTKGSRGAPIRQRTLWSCIEWSYDLCTSLEQSLWMSTSVFAGGFELDAAAAVCLDEAEDELLNALLSLVDKSILLREERDGQVRYRMLEVVRQHGQERMRTTGSLAMVQRRHRDFFDALVKQARSEWITDQQTVWFARLRREHFNLQAALEFCLGSPEETEAGLRVASGLLDVWAAYGHIDEGRHWVDRLLAASAGPTAARVAAIHTGIWLDSLAGDIQAADDLLIEGQALTPSVGGTSRLLITQASGIRALYGGDARGAVAALTEALEGFRETGDAYHVAQTLVPLGVACGFAGDIDLALACHRECMELIDQVHEAWFRSFSLWNAALLAFQLGDESGAARLAKEGLQLKQQLDDRLGIAMCMDSLASITAGSDPREAATLLGAAEAAYAAMGVPVDALPGQAQQRETCEARLLESLGERSLRRCVEHGRSLDRASALDFALGAKLQPQHNSPRERDSLTPREHEVAALLAQGLSNREIANHLVISKRTAESHVEHILEKLGFNARAQVAGWFTGSRREPSPPFDKRST